MDVKHIKRRLLEPLKDHLREKEITLITGPRQAGKTTIMSELQDYLAEKKQKTLFLSLDFNEDGEFFVSQEALLQKLKLTFGDQKGFVFIDEIQRKKDAGLFLKGIYDRNLQHKLIVSGSGSVELKEKTHESLAGRKIIFEMETISFEEFVDFRTEYRYGNRLDSFFALEKPFVERLLDEYMGFGGYPRVITRETAEAKTQTINEIYRSYVEKDIAFLLRVEKLDTFSNMLELLGSQAGGILIYSDIAQALDISVSTLKNYLWYAEKTFIVERVRPFSRNKRSEITKSPVPYFHDLGLSNYITGSFGHVRDIHKKSFLFQNLVWRMLLDATRFKNISIRFWRTKDGAEVDFVLDAPRGPVPIEVKYKELKKEEIERSMRSFIEKYSPKKAFVVNLSYEGKTIVGKTEVHFVPFWKLPRVDFLST